MKRNTLVLGAVLFLLATFAWAGWANFEYRKEAVDRDLATVAKGELVLDPSGSGGPQLTSPLKGKPAPAFALQDLSGKKVTLASYKGKAVLVNFWATWCAPCKIETPWLVDLRNQYAGQGFEILGLSTDDIDLDDAQKLTKEKLEISKFVDIYSTVNRIRVRSSIKVIDEADKAIRIIIGAYSSKNKTFSDLVTSVSNGEKNNFPDPLRGFSEACREDLESF